MTTKRALHTHACTHHMHTTPVAGNRLVTLASQFAPSDGSNCACVRVHTCVNAACVDSPQTRTGASSSRRMGWLSMTSRAFLHKMVMSVAGMLICLPGEPRTAERQKRVTRDRHNAQTLTSSTEGTGPIAIASPEGLCVVCMQYNTHAPCATQNVTNDPNTPVMA